VATIIDRDKAYHRVQAPLHEETCTMPKKTSRCREGTARDRIFLVAGRFRFKLVLGSVDPKNSISLGCKMFPPNKHPLYPGSV